MAKNIVLIGMSGCGKTIIGDMIAKRLNYNFIDTDEVIESYGMTIPELFESGEKSFRCIETMAVKEVSTYSNVVISTGGGVVTVKENMDYLLNNSLIVFIVRDMERIKKTLKNNKNRRPLLTNDDKLDKLYLQRINLYKDYADITVENNGSIYKTCDEILTRYKELQNENIST